MDTAILGYTTSGPSLFYISPDFSLTDTCNNIMYACNKFKKSLFRSNYFISLPICKELKKFYEQTAEALFLICVLHRYTIGEQSNIGEFRRCLCDFSFLQSLYDKTDKSLIFQINPNILFFMEHFLAKEAVDTHFKLLTAFRSYIMNIDIS